MRNYIRSLTDKKSRRFSCMLIGVFAVIAFVIIGGLPSSVADQSRGTVGPDVVAFTIAQSGGFDMEYYGSSGGVGGYAIATQSCNFGDMVANWFSGTNDVPVIAQNIFRLKDGVFEQIGLSWLKHSFCALSESGCGACQSTNCNTLGIGCADTYWAGLNADAIGPRSDINAYTGFYNYPFSISPTGTSSLRGKLQIHNADVDPAQNSGARYFIEGQYVTGDDASWSNQMNNASWREISFSSITSMSPVGGTNVGDPAIRGWASIDPSVVLTEKIVPSDGLLLIGAKATNLGNGTWHYEYAIHNLNSHRSVGGVEVPMTIGAEITNVSFHDVDYHSGEVIDGTDWSSSVLGDTVSWSTQGFGKNQNANAIRWGSMYNFRFDANVEPANGEITLTLFRPGSPNSVLVNTIVPKGAPPSLIINYPNGRPDLIDPNGGTTVDIDIASGAADPVGGTGMMHWSTDTGSGSAPLNELGGTAYQAVFPIFGCEDLISWYISIENSQSTTIFSPSGAPTSTWSAVALSGFEVNFEDDFEADLGWSTSGNATDGQWDRGVPIGGGDRCDPAIDADGSGSCYLTDNVDGNSDVDGGTTILTSPAMDASASPTLSYYRWYSNGSDCNGGSPMADIMEVEFSNDNGSSWLNLETIGPAGAEVSGNWFLKEFELSSVTGFVPSAEFRVRFIISDLGTGSVIEGGVDGITLSGGICDVAVCPSDVSGDGNVDVTDLLSLIAAWGPCVGCPEDIDGSGVVDVTDLLTLIAAWGPCV